MLERLRYEWYALTDTMEAAQRLYRKENRLRSLKMIFELFVIYGTYTDFNGNVKRGSYHQYSRDFWLGRKK